MEFLDRTSRKTDAIFEYFDSKHCFTAIVIFIVNVIFKSFYLENASLWLDEANHIYRSLHSFGEIFEKTIKGSNGPIYFYITHVWQKIFGVSIFSARFLSVIFSSLSAVAIFYFARKFIDTKTAIFAVIIFSLSKIQFYYAHEARSYAYISFLTILSFYYVLKIFDRSSIKNLIILTVIYILLFHTHVLVTVIIPIHFYIALLKYRQNNRAFFFVNLSLVITVITLVIWVLANPWLGGNETTWGRVPTFQTFINLMSSYSGSPYNLYLLILIFVVYLGITIYNYFRKRELDYDKFVMFQNLLLWAILPVVVIYFVSIYYNPRFIPRYMLYATPGLYLLFAFIITQFKIPDLIKLAILIYIVVFSLIGFNLNPYKGESWKEIVNYINEKNYNTDSTLMIVSPWYQHPSFAYYYDINAFKDYRNTTKILKKKNIYFSDSKAIFKKFNLDNFRNICLVLSQESVIDPERRMFKYVLQKSSIVDVQEKYTGVKLYMFDTKIQKDSIYDFNSFEDPELLHKSKTEDAVSGQHVYELNAEQQYSPGYSSKCSGIITNQYKLISLEVWIKYADPEINVKFVCSIENDNGFVLWKGLSVGEHSEPGSWQKINYDITIPDNISENDIIKVYVWNPGKTRIFLDNLKTTIR